MFHEATAFFTVVVEKTKKKMNDSALP